TLAGTKDRTGCLTNIIVGIIGAFIGGFIWSFFSHSQSVIGWSLGGLVLAVLGALVLLGLLKAIQK
ncbi:MAG: GlsB/YeaQ/YmgE family stress response membrane protein, partial [Thermomicrobiales bacterium]